MYLDWNHALTLGLIADYVIKVIAIGFVPEGRRPSSSTAWLLAILLLPYVGLPLFLLMGSPYINARRHKVQQSASVHTTNAQEDIADYPKECLTPALQTIFTLNRHLTSMPALTGTNHGLHSDYEATIARMAEAIDQAQEFVHVEIYIMVWDDTTDVFFRALERAVARGVKVRLLFDHVGSWKYAGYFRLGKRLSAIGVDWHMMLPLQPWKWRFRRPDLRNHRKMVIIDGVLGFIGSLNMIDSSYQTKGGAATKRRWVDIMMELSGPVVSSMGRVFAVDWYLESDEVLKIDNEKPHDANAESSNIMQLVPSGPGYTTEPNLRMFNSIIHHAQHHLVLCSPYFVPDESLLEAVTSACYRGVKVDLLVNEKSDQFMVGHAQSSYYQALLEAGVRIHQYPAPAVLHSKFLLADPEHPTAMGVLGSSNMDMRSFGLNYEISLLAAKGDIVSQLLDLANEYLDASHELTLEVWNQRSLVRRYIDNVMRLTSGLQ